MSEVTNTPKQGQGAPGFSMREVLEAERSELRSELSALPTNANDYDIAHLLFRIERIDQALAA